MEAETGNSEILEDQRIRMNPPPDTESPSPPLDTEDLKVLQDTKSQTTRTSSAVNVMRKDTTKVTVQGFRRRSPKRSSSRRRRKSSWKHGTIQTLLLLTQSQMMKEPTFIIEKILPHPFRNNTNIMLILRLPVLNSRVWPWFPMKVSRTMRKNREI